MIRRLQCPQCDREVRMGLPNGATIERISTESRPEPEKEGAKVREIACSADHHFFVLFEL